MNQNIGRISEQHHTIYKVLLPNQKIIETRVSGKFTYQNKKNTLYPAVGDYVVLNEKGLISEVQERKTVLQRMEAILLTHQGCEDLHWMKVM